MRILALSDVRIHDWSIVINFLKQKKAIGEKIDLLLYAGDDLERFLPLDFDTIKNQNFHLESYKSHEFRVSLKVILGIVQSEEFGISCFNKIREKEYSNRIRDLLIERFVINRSDEIIADKLLKFNRDLMEKDLEQIYNALYLPHVRVLKKDRTFIFAVPNSSITNDMNTLETIYSYYKNIIKKTKKKVDIIIDEIIKLGLNKSKELGSIASSDILEDIESKLDDVSLENYEDKCIDPSDRITNLLLDVFRNILDKYGFDIQYVLYDDTIEFQNEDVRISISLNNFTTYDEDSIKQRCKYTYQKETLQLQEKFCNKYEQMEHIFRGKTEESSYNDTLFDFKVFIIRQSCTNIADEIHNLVNGGICAIRGNDDDELSLARMKINNVFDLSKIPFNYNGLAIIGIEGAEEREIDDVSEKRENTKREFFERDNTKFNVNGLTELADKQFSSAKGYTTVKYEIIKKELKIVIEKSLYEKKEQKVIIVSHSPPLGVLDLAYRFGTYHIGSSALRETIEEYSSLITAVICGHVHSWGGIKSNFKGVPIYNVASHDRQKITNQTPLNGLILKLNDKKEIISQELINLASQGGKNCYDLPVTYLSNIDIKRQEMLNEVGISTIGDYCNSDYEELVKKLFKTNISTRKRIQWRALYKTYWAAKYLLGEIDNPVVLESIDYKKEKSIILDLETELVQKEINQNYGETRIWMIGIYNIEKREYKQFYLGDYENIKLMLKDFLNWIEENEIEIIYVYSSSKFDENILNTNINKYIHRNWKRNSERNTENFFEVMMMNIKGTVLENSNTDNLVIPHMKTKPKFINLYPIFFKNICLPSYKLSEISKQIFNIKETLSGFNCGQVGTHLIFDKGRNYEILNCEYCDNLISLAKQKNKDDIIIVAKVLEYLESLEVTPYKKQKKKTSGYFKKNVTDHASECVEYENGMKNCYNNLDPKTKEYICYTITEKMSRQSYLEKDENSSFRENHNIQLVVKISDVSLKECEIIYYFNIGRVRIKRDVKNHKNQTIGIDISQLTLKQLNVVQEYIVEL